MMERLVSEIRFTTNYSHSTISTYICIYIPTWLVNLCVYLCCVGTGKSLTASEVCSRTGMRHIDVGLVAKQQNLYDGFDEQYQCPILDEDKVR